MSKTLRLSDGDLYVGPDGKTKLLEEADKAAQDIAAALLQFYNSERAFGSEIDQLEFPIFASRALMPGILHQKIDQAMRRLLDYQEKNRYLTATERIVKYDVNIVAMNDLQFLFYVDARTAAGASAKKAAIVSLRHQLPESAIPSLPGKL